MHHKSVFAPVRLLRERLPEPCDPSRGRCLSSPFRFDTVSPLRHVSVGLSLRGVPGDELLRATGSQAHGWRRCGARALLAAPWRAFRSRRPGGHLPDGRMPGRPHSCSAVLHGLRAEMHVGDGSLRDLARSTGPWVRCYAGTWSGPGRFWVIGIGRETSSKAEGSPFPRARLWAPMMLMMLGIPRVSETSGMPVTALSGRKSRTGKGRPMPPLRAPRPERSSVVWRLSATSSAIPPRVTASRAVGEAPYHRLAAST